MHEYSTILVFEMDYNKQGASTRFKTGKQRELFERCGWERSRLVKKTHGISVARKKHFITNNSLPEKKEHAEINL